MQTPRQRARALARDSEAILRFAWHKWAGSPSKAFEDYDPLTLEATMFHLAEEIRRAGMRASIEEVNRERRRVFGKPVDYDEAVSTGDPLADQWERELARGETPDLTTKVVRKGR